jgi:hypothetical protein
VHGLHAATSKVVNSAQGSSCKLKFVHGSPSKSVNCQICKKSFVTLAMHGKERQKEFSQMNKGPKS